MRRMRIATVSRWTAVSAAVIAVSFGQGAQASDRAKKIDGLVRAYHDSGRFTGAVLVAEHGRVVYEDGVGPADLTWDIPNTPNTRFLIGSVGKVFTAIVVLQLVEEGALDLDRVVTHYLPAYRSDTGGRITLQHLLTHTSGLPDFFTRSFYEDHKDRFYSHEEFLERFLIPDLVSEPGTHARYSSANYYLLGMIVERVTGEAFGDVLEARVFGRLGMHDSGFYRHHVVEPRLATGYIKSSLGYSTAPFEIPESSAFAAGAMYSSARDFYRFDRALADGEVLGDTGRLLETSPETAVERPPNTRFAYGATVGERTVGPTGEIRLVHEMGGSTTTGFSSAITRVPQDDNLVVVLANAGPGHFNESLHRMTADILLLLYGGEPEPPSLGLAERLGTVVDREGVDAALSAYHAERASGGLERHETQLNLLGYDLLHAGRTHDAITIFELNAAEFPESANVYDSLGEAYALAGNLALARENYERVAELDPTGRLGANARKALERLR